MTAKANNVGGAEEQTAAVGRAKLAKGKLTAQPKLAGLSATGAGAEARA